MTFEYSDGAEIEQQILQLLRQAPEVDAAAGIALPQQRESWPVRYHLSVERSNLLRHLDFSGLDVLELGAGMGGVSRYLAENARSLVAVEASAARFDGLEQRLRGLANWSGKTCRAQDYSGAGTADVVCVIGVLEYAELYCQPEPGYAGDAFAFFLERAASFLKPGGVLLLAIENRLGLQYWSGVGEDHSGGLFDSLVGYPATPAVRTFSRRELRRRLKGAGLSLCREYFPFPDYKLPASVLTLDLLEADPALAADIATFGPWVDHCNPRSHLFPDSLVIQEVAAAGLLPELANSFLWAASTDPSSTTLRQLVGHGSASRRELGWHYSQNRRRPTRTVFFQATGNGPDPEGVLQVEKGLLTPDAPAETEFLAADGELTVRWQCPAPEPVAAGERLSRRLLRAVYFGQEDIFQDELARFLEWVLARGSRDAETLDGDLLDAVMTNVNVAGSEYRLFDHEWALKGPLPKTWLVLRNVLLFERDRAFFNDALSFGSLGELYESLCLRLGLAPNLAADVDREARFHGLAMKLCPESVRRDIEISLRHPFADARLPPRQAGFLPEWLRLEEELEKRNRNLEEKVQGLEKHIAWQSETVSLHERSLAQREQVIAWQSETMSLQERSLAQREQAIAWLEKEIAVRDEHLDGTHKELARYTAEVENRGRHIDRLQDNNARLGTDKLRLEAETRRLTQEVGRPARADRRMLEKILWPVHWLLQRARLS